MEPYLVAAPLRELRADERRSLPSMRQSMRYRPFPDPEARGREFVLADATMVSAADLLEHAPLDVDLRVGEDG